MQNYFDDDELQCPCCHKSKMDKTFMVKLNAAREAAGIPFYLSSAFRCSKHNAEIGSTANNHTTGNAADIHCTQSINRFKIVKATLDAGFTGIGIGKRFIHADTNHNTPMIWLY